MTKINLLLTFLLILAIVVATIHMINRAIQVDSVKESIDSNIKQ